MMKTLVSVALLSLAISVTAAVAQTPSKMSADDKKAISKSCSDQANAKGLHGKERKKFRSECKHAGGKTQ
jgi:hypothetical protein